jgi:hypothetical protein
MITVTGNHRAYTIAQPEHGRSAGKSQNQQWAVNLFQQAARQATLHSIICWLRRRDNRLWYLHPSTPMHQIGERHREQVYLEQIKGSTSSRCHDFDNQFRPLQNHTLARWLSVAMANRSRDLSPVDLIKVDNAYFVVDGHHRLSVAQALGQTEITANVIDYAIEPPQ